MFRTWSRTWVCSSIKFYYKLQPTVPECSSLARTARYSWSAYVLCSATSARSIKQDHDYGIGGSEHLLRRYDTEFVRWWHTCFSFPRMCPAPQHRCLLWLRKSIVALSCANRGSSGAGLGSEVCLHNPQIIARSVNLSFAQQIPRIVQIRTLRVSYA